VTFLIKTYGCQMNRRDSESVGSLLVRHGLTRVKSEARADIIIVNTCSVRGKAEDKALGKLGLLVASRKREHPCRIIGVMGCMVQRLKQGVFEKVPGLDFAVGTHRLAGVPGILDLLKEGRGPVLDIAEARDGFDALVHHDDGSAFAFVNILFGCDRRCAYCIVPDVRGREWSRPAASVMAEVTSLAGAGVREVTLLGQSVMMYGHRNSVWPFDYESSRGYIEPLSRLLEAVSDVEGIARVRFTSGHPSGCTPELARAMAELDAVASHMHLPLQSGSDRILKMMRRGYLSADYREAVSRLRESVPEIALTTDVIVGFPTETEREFEETRQFMDEIGFDNAFIFKYSPRPGTPAYEWPDEVSDAEKMRRNQVLLEDQDRRAAAINGRFRGRSVEVLVEGVSRRNSKRWSGRTEGNKIVVFAAEPGMVAGDMVRVKIDKVMPQTLYGAVAK